MFRITLILNNLLFEETGSSIYRKIPLPTDGRYSVISFNALSFMSGLGTYDVGLYQVQNRWSLSARKFTLNLQLAIF